MSATTPPSESSARSELPNGYRQALITAITVVLGSSVLFLRFIAFEPASGPWTALAKLSAATAAIAVIVQFVTLWRGLRVVENEPLAYAASLRWFAIGGLFLGLSLAFNMASSLFSVSENPQQPTKCCCDAKSP